MADVNANIGIHVDTSSSLAEIKALQRQLASLYTSINRGSAAAAVAQKGLATNLMNSINAGGKFYAQMGSVRTSTESFTHALEKNKLTMREYFRFAGGSTKSFGRLFKSEFNTIGRVAEERVKKMQTQYVKLGRDASGAMKAMSITPTSLNMKDYGNRVAVAAQKQAILNQLLRQGSTNVLNFGKNLQWSGRQLMVGFTVPLAYFGTAAAKTFMDLEKQAIRFKRVYGDMFTTSDQTNKALEDVQALAKEFTKYGVAVAETMEMAASAAAMGRTGADLTSQVAEATRLAVLGGVEQGEALKTTISLTDAFGIAAEDLTGKINFLNAVENQTITAIEDLTIAVPKAGPVVKQLGGSIEDLAFFLTAMREGGINASEGANALKSGLASLINPSDKAAAMLGDLGINIKGIVEGNVGNLKQTVIDFANALDTLAPLDRSRAIEQLFGKFQFARLSTLFENVTKEGGQAARVLDLAGKSIEELAILSERELGTLENAIGTNFRESLEKLKLSIAPIGKEFLKVLTPVVKFFGDLFEKFGNLSEGSKKFVVILTTLIGLVGPTLLMTLGLLANGAANIIKMFLLMRTGFQKLTGNSTILAQSTQYLNTEQMEAAIVATSLNQAHSRLTQQFNIETGAVNQLRNAYIAATAAAARFAAANPGMMIRGVGKIPKKFNSGTMKVPGYKKGTDSVPAMLTPGEAVIPEPIAQNDRFKPLIAALVSGEIAKYNGGTIDAGSGQKSKQSNSAISFAHMTGDPQPKSIDDLIKSDLFKGTALDDLKAYQKAGMGSAVVNGYTSLGFDIDKKINADLSSKTPKVSIQSLIDEIKQPGSIRTSANSLTKNYSSVLSAQGVQPVAIMEQFRGDYVKELEKLQRNGVNFVNDSMLNEKITKPLLSGTSQYSSLIKTIAGVDVFQKPTPKQIQTFLKTNGIPMKRGQAIPFDEANRILGKQLSSDVFSKQMTKNMRNSGVQPTVKIYSASDGRLLGVEIFEPGSKSASYTGLNLGKRGGRLSLDLIRAKGSERFGGYRNLKDSEQTKNKSRQRVGVTPGEVVLQKGKMPQPVEKRTSTRAKKLNEVVVPPSKKDTLTTSINPRKQTIAKLVNFLPGNANAPLVGVASSLSETGAKTAQQIAAQHRVSLSQAKRMIAENEKGIKAQQNSTAATKKTTKQTRSLGQKFGTGINVFSGLTIAGSFMGGKIGEVSQKLVPFAIGLSTIQMLLPGLKAGVLKFGRFLAMNPLAAVAIAAAGLVVAAKVLDEKMKKQARAQSDYIDTISATTEKMKRVGEITGIAGASEIMQRRRQGATADKFSTGFDRAGQQFGTSFIESEVGKEILTNFQTNLAKGGSSAVKQIALELSSYVSDGLMTADDANSVARSIGINMSDMAIAANIQGEIRSIIGPDGQDLLTNPLKVRLEIVEESTKSVQDVTKAITKDMKEYNKILNPATIVKEFGKMRDFAAAGAAAGVQALEALQAQRDAQNKMTEDKIKDLETEKAKTADKKRQAEIESEISTLKEKQTSDDEKLAAQRPKIIKDQLKLFKQVKGEGKIETAFFEGTKQQVRTKFKDDPFTNKFIDFAAGLENQELAVQLLTTVGAGDLSPRAAINFIELFKGDEATLDTVINSKVALENPDKFAQLQSITSGLKGKKAKKVGLEIITSLTAKGQEGSFDDRLAALTMLQKLDGKEINVAVFLEGKADKKLDELVPLLNEVEKLKGPIDIKVIQTLEKTEGMPDLQGLVDDWEHYKNLPDEIQKTAIQTYIAIYKSIGDKEIAEELLNQTGGNQSAAGFLAERANKKTVKGQAAARLNKEIYASEMAAAGGAEAGEGGGEAGKNRNTTLDELLKRLKFIRKASIDAEGGVEELLRITGGKGLQKFGGVTQQLMAGPKGGFNREFISFLESMDDKTRATYMTIKKGKVVLTDQGKALKEAFNEKVIGEYQVANEQSLQDTKAQGAALLKLEAAGVDSATALEMVADANLAVAINSKDITSEELNNMAKDAQKAKDAIEKLNLEVLNLSESLKSDIGDAQKTLNALFIARQSGIVDPEVLEFISKDMSVINNILQKGIGNSTVQSILASKDALKKLNEEMQGAINPAEKAMQTFLKLKDAAFELFDQQQAAAQSKFNAGMRRTVGSLAKFATLPDRFKSLSLTNAMDLAETEIEALDDQIKTIQNRDIRPIDIEIEAKESAIDDIMTALNTQAAGITKGFSLPAAAYKDVADGLKESIEKIQLDVEFNFDRPLEILQEESSDLSNELTLMDRVVDGINKKYDAQAEALQKVSDLNQEIADQQRSQLDLAGALSSGDIAAAARAAQEIRAQAASRARDRASGVLDAARQAEIGGVRSAGGMTRTQIEERQFQISQQIFAIEEKREAKQLAIRDIQDQINAGEVAREAFLKQNVLPIENAILVLQNTKKGFVNEIKILEDAIFKLQVDILDPLQQEADLIAQELADTTAKLEVKRQEWAENEAALKAATTATTALAKEAGTAQAAFQAAFAAYDAIKSKTVTITVVTNNVSTGSTGTGTGSTGTGTGSTGTGTGSTGTGTGSTVTGTKVVDGRTVVTSTSGNKSTSSPFNTSLIAGKMYGGKILPMAMGGSVPKVRYESVPSQAKGYSLGGSVGSDTVPAMLTPGEYVVNKASAKAFLPLLSALNESKFPSSLSKKMSGSAGNLRITKSFNPANFDVSAISNPSFIQPSFNVANSNVTNAPINNVSNPYSDNSSAVYNYSVGISVGGSNVSPDNIARAVMKEIKYIDSKRVRNQKAG